MKVVAYSTVIGDFSKGHWFEGYRPAFIKNLAGMKEKQIVVVFKC